MKLKPSYMELDHVVSEFKKVFNTILKTCSNATSLDGIPYWKEEWSSYSRDVEFKLLNGFFLNFSSRLPTESELHSVFSSEMNDKKILVPNVRDFSIDNFNYGFSLHEIKCGYEFTYEIKPESFEEDLKRKIGSKKYRDIMRLHRRALEVSYLETFSLNELFENKQLMEDVDLLFFNHELSYGHTRRIYGIDYIKAIYNSRELRGKYQVWIRKNKDGKCIQAMILLMDFESRTVYYIAQAIDKLLIGKGINLFKASFIDVYYYSKINGFEFVNLGRDTSMYKVQELGATIVIPHSHLIISVQT